MNWDIYILHLSLDPFPLFFIGHFIGEGFFIAFQPSRKFVHCHMSFSYNFWGSGRSHGQLFLFHRLDRTCADPQGVTSRRTAHQVKFAIYGTRYILSTFMFLRNSACLLSSASCVVFSFDILSSPRFLASATAW